MDHERVAVFGKNIVFLKDETPRSDVFFQVECLVRVDKLRIDEGQLRKQAHEKDKFSLHDQFRHFCLNWPSSK